MIGGGVGSAVGSSSKLEGKAIGATYDTLTQKPGNPVTARIRGRTDGLSGQLNVAGFQIPLESLNTRTGPADRPFDAIHTAELDQPQFTRRVDGKEVPLRVRMYELEESLSGSIRRPNTQFGELGFFVFDDTMISTQQALAQKSMVEKWQKIADKNGVTFSVPRNGLPTDTGLKTLRTLKGGDS